MSAWLTFTRIRRKKKPADPYQKIRSILYKNHAKGKFKEWNKERIDYVIDNVYSKQMERNNPWEDAVARRLDHFGIPYTRQEIIPVLSRGGKIEHLYIADFLSGSTIIEVDGKQHLQKQDYDHRRDQETTTLGYSTIRIPTDDLRSYDRLDKHIQHLIPKL